MNKVLQLYKSNGKIKISSPFFFLYFLYFVFIQLTVFFDFLIENTNYSPTSNVASRLFILLFLFIFVFIFHKYLCIRSLYYSKMHVIIGCIFIACISIPKIVYPDTNYDTLHYHLIVQRQGFTNYFSENLGFARGNFQIWGFPLGDKAFWYFRKFLGYRLGTILNSISLFIIYIQIIQILNILFPNNDYNKNSGSKFKYFHYYKTIIFSLIIITSHYIILNIGTYMVDTLALPFVMECLIILLKISESNKNNGTLFYYSMLCGLCLSIKLTNIIYVIPLAILIIIKTFRILNVKTILICIFLALIPCSPFVIYNYKITNNPVFPYYNNFFKSSFFPYINFKDSRFGPQNKLQSFIWVLYFIMPQNSRLSEISSRWNFLYLLGVIGLLIWFLNFIKKEQEKSENITNYNFLAFFSIICSFLWGISSGYARYFEGGMIIYGIFSYYFLYKLINFCKKYLRLSIIYIFQILCCVILITQSFCTIKSFINGREWAWRNFNTTSFKENIVLLFNDKMKNNKFYNETFYITDSMYCGVADYISQNSKIYNISYINYYLTDDTILSKSNPELVYDIKDVSFVITDQYNELFAKYDYKLEETEIINTDFGKYLLIKFKKNIM